jgi:hypothetical protein
MKVHSTDHKALGAITFPHIASSEKHYLVPGRIGPFNVSGQELKDFLQMQQIPVRNSGNLYWSDSIDLSPIN